MMANFLSYDIPARRTKSARVRTYQRLKGVDFSSDEAQVALQRSPNSLNMYKNYSVELGQCVETRPGFRRQVVFPEKEDNTVYGQLFFENRTETVTKIQPLFHVYAVSLGELPAKGGHAGRNRTEPRAIGAVYRPLLPGQRDDGV